MRRIGTSAVGPAGGPVGVARAARSGLGFASRLDGAGGAEPAVAAGAAGSIAAVGPSLLALQEDRAGPAPRDAAARDRGDRLALELRGLQLELLGSAPDPRRLARLAALREGEAAADPVLAAAVAALTLRAEIELVRRGWDGSASTM